MSLRVRAARPEHHDLRILVSFLLPSDGRPQARVFLSGSQFPTGRSSVAETGWFSPNPSLSSCAPTVGTFPALGCCHAVGLWPAGSGRSEIPRLPASSVNSPSCDSPHSYIVCGWTQRTAWSHKLEGVWVPESPPGGEPATQERFITRNTPAGWLHGQNGTLIVFASEMWGLLVTHVLLTYPFPFGSSQMSPESSLICVMRLHFFPVDTL